MVEDSVSDGKRIAQLLASELTGLDIGPLADASVADAVPDATPSPEGTEAYRLNDRDGTVATVSMYPDHARVSPVGDVDFEPCSAGPPTECSHVSLESVNGELVIRSGGAVKPAVDAIRLFLDRIGEAAEDRSS